MGSTGLDHCALLIRTLGVEGAAMFQPMNTAPRDETMIIIKTRNGDEFPASYWDCNWMRDQDPKVTDCWLIDEDCDDPCIELDDVVGWKPIN